MSAVRVPIRRKLCVWSSVVVVVNVAMSASCTPAAFNPATEAVAVPTIPAEAVARPETVTAPLNVFAPAKVCVPVETVPLKLASASGMLRFNVLPDRLNPMAAEVVVMAGV